MMVEPDEDIIQTLADGAAASPTIRARLEEVAREAWAWVHEAEAAGLVRVHRGDGSVVLELLDRRLH
jgi:hypothetical protein